MRTASRIVKRLLIAKREAVVVEVFKGAAIVGGDGAPDKVLHAAATAPSSEESRKAEVELGESREGVGYERDT